jgi:glycosyltransferase involved in cell wall biosynthesis
MTATELADEWNITHVATHRDGTTLVKIFQFACSIPKFVYLVLRDRPVVVHVHVSSRGSFFRKYIICLIARAMRLPVIAHVHGAKFDAFYANSPQFVKSAVRNMLAAAAAVVALGESWGERLESMEPSANVIVIPNPARPVAGVEQPTGVEPVAVLFLGRIDDSKGVWCLIEAWHEMLANRDGRPATLTLAGDGELDRAAAMVRDLGLTDSVTLTGWVDPVDVPALLRASQVLVLPSRHEGQSMAVLEAMANGLCVIVTPVGGMPELIADGCGILVPTGDVHLLAKALDNVVSDDQTRMRMGAAALQRVKDQFDIDVIWRRFDQLYREHSR